MKKIKTILAVILAAATMTTFSCNRDEGDTTNNNQNQQQQQQDSEHPTDKDLSGTTWESHIDAVYHYSAYNIDLGIELDMTFDFNDSLNAEMYMYMVVNYPEEMGMPPQAQDFSEKGVYYFDGQKLYMHDPDDYSPYTEDEKIMTFNAADTTFIMPIGDPEMEEMLGTDEIILHLTHGTLNLK